MPKILGMQLAHRINLYHAQHTHTLQRSEPMLLSKIFLVTVIVT